MTTGDNGLATVIQLTDDVCSREQIQAPGTIQPAVAREEQTGTKERSVRGVDTLALLRQATRDLHAEIEHHPLMLPLSEGRVTPRQYRDALAVIYGFYRPIEERLYAKFPHLAETMGIRPKLPALVHDLVALGFSDMDVAALPLCGSIPWVEDWGQGLGMVYVLEGATLGGQVVMRRISHCLGALSGVATSFHNFHGDHAGPHWRQFQTRMAEQLDAAPAAQQRAAESAVETFKALNDWFTASGKTP